MSAELERELRALAVEWPATPDVADRVVARLAQPRPRRRWRRRVAAAAGGLAVAAGVAMAVEPARSAVLDWLGFGAVRIEHREPRGRPGARLDLGRPVALADARAAVGFPVAVPAALGTPDAVLLDRDATGGPRVSLVYAPAPGRPAIAPGVGVLVTQLRGRTSAAIVKAVGPGTTLQRLTIDGDPAIFLSGDPHGVVYEPRPGDIVFEDERRAADVLLVDRADGVLVRIEGRLDRAAAVRIARSLG
jgi:hypothetical protein